MICTRAYLLYDIHQTEIGDEQKLQDDKLVKWSEPWQMSFNLGNVNVYTQGREIRA